MTAAGHHPPYAGMVSRVSGLAIDAGMLAIASSLAVSGVPAVWSALAGQAPAGSRRHPRWSPRCCRSSTSPPAGG
ncbi:hypothetical protein ACFQZ4_36200 [Catellatospora coxensis]